MNYALSIIYGSTAGVGLRVPEDDVIAIFDCDCVCSPHFFKKMIPPLLASERVGMVRLILFWKLLCLLFTSFHRK